MFNEQDRLSGLEKASVLMMSLGAETSARVFEHLTATERELLGAEIVKIRRVDPALRDTVLEEVREIVTSAPAMADSSNQPMRWLEDMPFQDVAGLLESERPQNVALVLAHLSPAFAAKVLSGIDEKTRVQAVERLASMGQVSDEIVAMVDHALRERLVGSGGAETAPRETLVSILGTATEKVRSSVIGVLSKSAQNRTVAINGIETLAELSDGDIREFLEEVNFDDLGLALRVASDEARSSVIRNLPSRIAVRFRDELDMPANVRLREVECAQERVIQTLERLAEQGIIKSAEVVIE